jgi:multidrug efflux system membrane fusion protein
MWGPYEPQADPLTESERIEPLARTRFVGDLLDRPRQKSVEPAAVRAPTRAAVYLNVDSSPMTGLRLPDRRASLLFYSASLLVPFALTACAKKQDRPVRQAATVAVAQARRANVPYVIEANGVVSPMQSVAVTPQVDGIIIAVDFQEGQEVRQGQALFHVDPRPYENAHEQALAVLARDSATWVNAKGNADRYRQLLAAKVITPQETDVQLTTAATAEATLRSDRASVAQAKFNLENTVIRAPIAGKTGSLLVKRGNLVRSGGNTPLVVINQVRPILVRFAIPSSQLPLVLQYGARGGLEVAAVPGGVAPASPSIDSLAAAATANPIQDRAGRSGVERGGTAGGGVAGGGVATDGAATDGASGSTDGSPRGRRGGRAEQAPAVQQGGAVGDRMFGKLSFIDNAVDTTTGTVQLKATFDNMNGRLWAGQFASTSLHLFDEDSALVVPAQAIVTGQRGSYVYIVDRGDTARQRAVVVERTAGGLAIVATGLREGDRVVTDGQSRLTPDSPVRVRGPNDTGAGGQGPRRGRGGRGGNGAGGGAGTADAGGGQGRRPGG